MPSRPKIVAIGGGLGVLCGLSEQPFRMADGGAVVGQLSAACAVSTATGTLQALSSDYVMTGNRAAKSEKKP